MYIGAVKLNDKDLDWWINRILVAMAVVTVIVLAIHKFMVMMQPVIPPIAIYQNYWSGEVIPADELAGATWDVVMIEPVYDLRDPNELATYTVEVSRFKSTPGETNFQIEDWVYSQEALEMELDAGSFD